MDKFNGCSISSPNISFIVITDFPSIIFGSVFFESSELKSFGNKRDSISGICSSDVIGNSFESISSCSVIFSFKLDMDFSLSNFNSGFNFSWGF